MTTIRVNCSVWWSSSRWYSGVAQQHFYLFYFFCVDVQYTFSTCEFYDSTHSLLRHCASFFRQEVNFPCIEQAVLLMGDEKHRTEKALPCCSVAGGTWGFLSSPIASCQSALTNLHQQDWQIHTPTNTGTHSCTLHHAISYLPITAD